MATAPPLSSRAMSNWMRNHPPSSPRPPSTPPPYHPPPPTTCGTYHATKTDMTRTLNHPPTIEEVAATMGISVQEAHRCEKLINDIFLEARDPELYQANKHTEFLNLNKGGKSRRHGKKSRRHAKKSRRHGKKSRRHGKKCRR